MLSLNLSFVDRGYSFQICKDLEKPLVIYNYYDYDLQDKMINNTNSIKFENCKCTVIEVDIDKSKSAYFKILFKDMKSKTAKLLFIYQPGKNLKHLIIQIIQLILPILMQKKDQNLILLFLDQGSKLRKDDYYISLNKENSIAKINSAAILKKDEHHEVKTTMLHSRPHCKSH